MSIITVCHVGSKLLSHGSKDVLLTLLKPGFHMIATIATIAAQRSLRSLRAYGNRHSAIFAIVATVIAEMEKFLSLRSLRSTVATIAECMFPYARKDRSDRCDHMETRLKASFEDSEDADVRICGGLFFKVSYIILNTDY